MVMFPDKDGERSHALYLFPVPYFHPPMPLLKATAALALPFPWARQKELSWRCIGNPWVKEKRGHGEVAAAKPLHADNPLHVGNENDSATGFLPPNDLGRALKRCALCYRPSPPLLPPAMPLPSADGWLLPPL